MKKHYTDNRYIKPFVEGKRSAIIFDMDGTLALHDGRSPFDYDKIPTDKPNWPLIEIMKTLSLHHQIIIVSGREDTGECRNLTCNWIDDNYGGTYEFFMRKKLDHRADDIVKKEIYKNNIEPRYNILAVYDDRNKVADMWRELGLLCCQVYYGDF